MIKSAGIEFIRVWADWDTHDAYASMRSLQFDIAEAWYTATGEALEGFTPGDGGVHLEDTRAIELSKAMADGWLDREAVDYWWTVLDRMETLVIAAGRDY